MNAKYTLFGKEKTSPQHRGWQWLAGSTGGEVASRDRPPPSADPTSPWG